MVKQTLPAFEAFVGTIEEPDEALQARIAVGYALARQIDDMQSSESTTFATYAMALPSMTKELRAVIDEIQERIQGDDEFLRACGLAGDAEVGNTSN